MRWRASAQPSSRRSRSSSDPRTSCSTGSSQNRSSATEGANDLAVRVVIAEDEAIIRLDLKEILEEEGYEVVGETGRGDEAVELVKQLEADLAILDIKMPGLDGLSAAREISGERRAAGVILNAFCQRGLVGQARGAGAVAVLVRTVQE